MAEKSSNIDILKTYTNVFKNMLKRPKKKKKIPYDLQNTRVKCY